MSLIGLEITPNNHREKTLSGLVACMAIALTIAIATLTLDRSAAIPVVASMGASAVLLFALPHGPLSQPWPLIGGHLISALAGVTCARFIGSPALAGGVAVGLAVTLMYYGRCIHPPGGATALTAVLSPAVLKLGYAYVLMPVALNVVILLACAVLLNAWFAWRRYPAALAPSAADDSHQRLTRDDWAYALRQAGSLMAVSEEELTELHAHATQHAASRRAARSRNVPHYQELAKREVAKARRATTSSFGET